MDRTTFEKNIERLKTGEFMEDRAIFDYASDSLFEIKTLLSALRQCCDFQQQKIRILRRLNDTLNAQVKDKDDLIDFLTEKQEQSENSIEHLSQKLRLANDNIEILTNKLEFAQERLAEKEAS